MLHHLVRGDVLRPARVAEQLGQLVALGDELIEHLHVLRVRAVREFHVHAAAKVVAARVREHRDGVGVVDGERDLAVLVPRVPGDVVGRQAVELRRVVHGHGAQVGADVAREGLADLDQLLAPLGHLAARRLVAVHSGEPEVAQSLLHVIARFGVGALEVEGGQGVVDGAVEGQLGGGGRGLLAQLLGGSAQPGIGMDVLHQRGLRGDRIELEQRIVVGTERIRDGARACGREQPGDRPTGAGQAFVVRGLERDGVGQTGPERRVRGGGGAAGIRWSEVERCREEEHEVKPSHGFHGTSQKKPTIGPWP